MKVAVMGDRHTVQTFSLAGVKENYTADNLDKLSEMEDEFDRFTSDENISIIFMTERTASAIAQKIRYHAELKSLYPLIITIPDVLGESEGEDRLKKLIRRAVGVDIRED